MHKKLNEILNKTNKELLERKKRVRPFKVFKKGHLNIIAEVKLASPSEGKLGQEKEMASRVKEYEKAGAVAISVVTEKHFFKGDPKLVGEIKKISSLPVLQKDFILDESQIYQQFLDGADAILLIVRILSKEKLQELVKTTIKLGLEPVVEINSQADLVKALSTTTKIIAVNARDLDSFKVDVDKACELLKKVPNRFIKLGFSGVMGKTEVNKYQKAEADGILIGTSLMKSGNINKFLEDLKFPQVKICGIRTEKAAKVAIKSGADFLGFNFVNSSKRYIDPKLAKKIIKTVKGKAKLVGVFQNAPISEVNNLAAKLDLDLVQLHGTEDDKYISKVKLPVIKSVTASSKPNGIPAKYLLIDREKRGEGSLVDPKKAKQFTLKYQIFLAGGLTAGNVSESIQRVQPFAVDVAGGIETNGVQDMNKIKDFIKNAKGVL